MDDPHGAHRNDHRQGDRRRDDRRQSTLEAAVTGLAVQGWAGRSCALLPSGEIASSAHRGAVVGPKGDQTAPETRPRNQQKIRDSALGRGGTPFPGHHRAGTTASIVQGCSSENLKRSKLLTRAARRLRARSPTRRGAPAERWSPWVLSVAVLPFPASAKDSRSPFRELLARAVVAASQLASPDSGGTTPLPAMQTSLRYQGGRA